MKSIIIFGTGTAATKIMKYIDKSKAKVKAVLDNDENKWNTEFMGHKISNPLEIKKLEFDYILIGSSYWKEITQQLTELGVDKNKIISPYKRKYTKREYKKYKEIYNTRGIISYFYNRRKKYEEFNPNILSLLTDASYFSRKDLYQSIQNNSQYISGRCMDFGCGTEPYRKLFAVSEYVGVEIEQPDKEKNIVYYDGKTIPFEDEYFDSILSSEVFEHVINIEEIVTELYRVLKKDGYMLVTVPFIFPKHCWPNDYKRYTEKGLKKLLVDAGFEVVDYKMNSSAIKCIRELENIYIVQQLMGKNKGLDIILKCRIAFNNILGKLLGKSVPTSETIYLDNVIVVKKVS